MTGAEWLDLVVGLLQLVLALAVLRQLARFGRRYPWLVALMAFFAVRGIFRVYSAFSDRGESALALVADGLVVLVLILLILGLERTVTGLREAEEGATRREAEYERALADYRALARHRLANPLAALRGGIQTLRAREELDRETQLALLDSMDEAAGSLEEIALDPRTQGAEERPLRAEPDV